MVPLDRALVSSYRLSIVTMSQTAAVWPQFATQVFRGGIGRLTCLHNFRKFTFRAQATTCSRDHTRTVMDAGCECAPLVRSANPSNSWALVNYSFQLSCDITCLQYTINNNSNTILLFAMLSVSYLVACCSYAVTEASQFVDQKAPMCHASWEHGRRPTGNNCAYIRLSAGR